MTCTSSATAFKPANFQRWQRHSDPPVFGAVLDEALTLEQADVLDYESDSSTTEKTRSYYHRNALGSVVEITDGSKRAPAAVALKKAQEFIRDHPDHPNWKHPYYWAAWVLWGLPD